MSTYNLSDGRSIEIPEPNFEMAWNIWENFLDVLNKTNYGLLLLASDNEADKISLTGLILSAKNLFNPLGGEWTGALVPLMAISKIEGLRITKEFLGFELPPEVLKANKAVLSEILLLTLSEAVRPFVPSPAFLDGLKLSGKA